MSGRSPRGFWRLALALPLLLVAGARAGEPRPKAWRGLFAVAAVSGLFFAADLGTWHVGILHTRLANATLFGNITAILFPAYGFLVARHWPSRRQGVAMGLALAGAALLLGRSYELAARNMLGDLLCIFAGLCYTGYLVSIDRVRSQLGPITTLTLSVVAGMPCLLLVAIGFGESIWPADWTPLVLLTLGSQIVGQGMILFAVSRGAADRRRADAAGPADRRRHDRLADLWRAADPVRHCRRAGHRRRRAAGARFATAFARRRERPKPAA